MKEASKKRLHLWKIGLFLLVLVSGIVIPAQSSWASLAFSYHAFPEGKLGIARPAIGITLKQPDSNKLASYEMYLNNQKVQPLYDANTSTISYQPTADLAPADYDVKVLISYEGYEMSTISFKFSIAQGASSLSTDISQEQRGGLQAINDYRLLLGLSPIDFNSALNTAAQKHAEYLFANQIDPVHTSISLHVENQSLKAFIGESLSQRMDYVGYTHGSAEDVAYKESTLIEAIDSLFEAPYHRIPFLSPALKEIGVYKKGNYDVIEFGFNTSSSPQLVVSPSDGDVFVPTTFGGHESPDPIRMYTSAEYPVGYPIMASMWGEGIQKTDLIKAELKDESGHDVLLYQNQASNDNELTSEVMLIPVKPLLADTIYQATVQVNATLDDGTKKTFDRTWKFRTEPTAGIGVLKLHQDVKSYLLQLNTLGLNRDHVVSFGLDNNYYQVDQMNYPMKVAPYIVDGSSFLYIRDLAASLGATVTWDDSRKAAIYTKKDQTVTFFTNRNIYAINGVEMTTSTPAQLINETTMIPVRLLSETLGAKVGYDEPTRTVTLTY
jgi:uncharacterized protein YkwD